MPPIASFTCRFFDLPLHAIARLDNHELLHLSFCPQRHASAVNWLQQRGVALQPAAPDQHLAFCATLVPLWRGAGTRPMPPASPFFAAGTEFQQRVWRLISAIPFGQTATYGELARQLGNVRLSRAVGQACNANPLALYIPCHRVVGARGSGGFAGGPTIKQRLLALEQQPS